MRVALSHTDPESKTPAMSTQVAPKPVAPPKTAAERKRAQRERQRASTRTDERQLAVACAEELRAVAAKFPEHASGINQTINRILEAGQRTKDRDRDAVMKAVHQGCWTVADVSKEARIPKAECETILEGLVAVKVLKKKPRRKPFEDGAPEMLYMLTGREPSTLMVLP